MPAGIAPLFSTPIPMLQQQCRPQPQKEQADSGTGGGEQNMKRLRRLLKNRESAQASRERKKAYVETLERQIQSADTTLHEAHSELINVHREIIKLHQTLLRTNQLLPPSTLSICLDGTFSPSTFSLLSSALGPACEGACAFPLTVRDFPLTALNGREPVPLADVAARGSQVSAYTNASDTSTIVATLVVPPPPKPQSSHSSSGTSGMPQSCMVVFPVLVRDWSVGENDCTVCDVPSLLCITAPAPQANSGSSSSHPHSLYYPHYSGGGSGSESRRGSGAGSVDPCNKAPELIPSTIRTWMDDSFSAGALARRGLRSVAEERAKGDVAAATARITISEPGALPASASATCGLGGISTPRGKREGVSMTAPTSPPCSPPVVGRPAKRSALGPLTQNLPSVQGSNTAPLGLFEKEFPTPTTAAQCGHAAPVGGAAARRRSEMAESEAIVPTVVISRDVVVSPEISMMGIPQGMAGTMLLHSALLQPHSAVLLVGSEKLMSPGLL